jgi:hypothetical protein
MSLNSEEEPGTMHRSELSRLLRPTWGQLSVRPYYGALFSENKWTKNRGTATNEANPPQSSPRHYSPSSAEENGQAEGPGEIFLGDLAKEAEEGTPITFPTGPVKMHCSELSHRLRPSVWRDEDEKAYIGHRKRLG